jgi:hypothetical protein
MRAYLELCDVLGIDALLRMATIRIIKATRRLHSHETGALQPYQKMAPVTSNRVRGGSTTEQRRRARTSSSSMVGDAARDCAGDSAAVDSAVCWAVAFLGGMEIVVAGGGREWLCLLSKRKLGHDSSVSNGDPRI